VLCATGFQNEQTPGQEWRQDLRENLPNANKPLTAIPIAAVVDSYVAKNLEINP